MLWEACSVFLIPIRLQLRRSKSTCYIVNETIANSVHVQALIRYLEAILSAQYGSISLFTRLSLHPFLRDDPIPLRDLVLLF